MKLQPTASRAELFVECQFPWGVEIPEGEDSKGDNTRYGTAFHELIASALRTDGAYLDTPEFDDDVRKLVEKHKLPPSMGDLGRHVRKSFFVLWQWLSGDNPWGIDFTKYEERWVEVSRAYDVRNFSSRSTTLDDKHHYDLLPNEMGGTVDLCFVSRMKGRPTLVLDHKTGDFKDYSQPGVDPQLLTLGLMCVEGSFWTEEDILAVFSAPRLGVPIVYADSVSGEQFQAHARRLEEAYGRVGDGSMRPGPWCQFCPARPVCPAADGEVVKAAMTAVTSLARPDVTTRGLSLPEKLGVLHQTWGDVMKLKAASDRKIREYVESNPGEVVTRPDGKFLQFETHEVERLSKASIIRKLGPEAGEKFLQDLRDRGLLESADEISLRAVPNEGTKE